MKVFVPIEKMQKNDDGTLEIWGVASSEAKDSQGEIVKAQAIRDALPEYFAYGSGPLREMHEAKAAGCVLKAEVDDEGITHIYGKVVDPVAVLKVEEQVYKGFSIGGKRLQKIGDEVTKIKLAEISLVDRPANPDSVITLWKADEPGDTEPEPEATEKRDFSGKERESAADSGAALPDGSFPIKSTNDLKNAIKAYGRAKDKEKAKAHIIRRAKALGATNLLPADWPGSTKKEAKKMDLILELAKAEGAQPVKDVLQKWLGEEVSDAGSAVSALMSIIYLYQKEASEEHEEAPAQMTALQDAIKALKAFIVSEIQEADESDVIVLAERASDLTKAIEAGDLEKIGATHSKKTMEKLQAIHDHTADLGAACKCAKCQKAEEALDLAKAELATEKESRAAAIDMVKTDDAEKLAKAVADHTEALAKLQADHTEALSKLEAEKADALAKIEEMGKAQAHLQGILMKAVGWEKEFDLVAIEALPAPAKGARNSLGITKSQDAGTPEMSEVEEKIIEKVAALKADGKDAEASREFIKLIHTRGGVPLVKRPGAES